MEEEVQSIKAEMQRRLDSVQENLQWIPILEKGLEAVMKLDQLLLQRGEGSSNVGIILSRGKHVMEELNSERCGLELKMTELHQEEEQVEGVRRWNNLV